MLEVGCLRQQTYVHAGSKFGLCVSQGGMVVKVVEGDSGVIDHR